MYSSKSDEPRSDVDDSVDHSQEDSNKRRNMKHYGKQIATWVNEDRRESWEKDGTY